MAHRELSPIQKAQLHLAVTLDQWMPQPRRLGIPGRIITATSTVAALVACSPQIEVNAAPSDASISETGVNSDLIELAPHATPTPTRAPFSATPTTAPTREAILPTPTSTREAPKLTATLTAGHVFSDTTGIEGEETEAHIEVKKTAGGTTYESDNPQQTWGVRSIEFTNLKVGKDTLVSAMEPQTYEALARYISTGVILNRMGLQQDPAKFAGAKTAFLNDLKNSADIPLFIGVPYEFGNSPVDASIQNVKVRNGGYDVVLRDLRQSDTHTANCVPAPSTLESQFMVCVDPEGKLLIGIDTKFMQASMQEWREGGYPAEYGIESTMTQTWRDSLALLIRFADLDAGKEKYGGAIHGDPKRSSRQLSTYMAAPEKSSDPMVKFIGTEGILRALYAPPDKDGIKHLRASYKLSK